MTDTDLMADATLVRQARDGDPAAVDELLGAVRPAVSRFTRARLCTYAGGKEVAEDVTQEVCLAVFDVLPRYTERGLPFAALVYAIASNKVADAQRAYARSPFHVVEEMPEQTSREQLPDERFIADADADAALSLLTVLPARAARIVLLRAHGYTAIEVGEHLGMTANAVRVAHHRALRDIRVSLS
jgi:RNA polymerase sigma-70 factor (ECF subfamily)